MLTGTTNEEKIWNYLTAAGLSACGAAGLMGNLYAESGLSPTNLQNTYEKKLGYTDASYTAAVDCQAYTDFDKDGAGYGLAQWTYHTRKAGLWAYAMSTDRSIGDLQMQLEWLMGEMESSFPAVLAVLKSAKSVRAASDAVLLNYERPADQSAAVQVKRAGYGQTYYDKYAGASAAPVNGGTTMTEQELRQQVVSTAQGWLGCRESDGSHRKIIDLYNSHTPLARGYKVQYTDAWCATFVSAVAIKAGVTDIIPLECGCGRMIELFQKLGCWQENDAYIPSPGDVIFYDWQDGTNYAAADNKGAADHVGIVVYAIGKRIQVIEGNKNDAVEYRMMDANGRYIRGYGLPNYAKKAGNPAAEAIDKLARLGVIDSPDLWKTVTASGKVKYLDALFCKAAAKITRTGPRSSTPENGIGNLVEAGVIDTPDYWLAHYGDLPYLGTLLCALGGAVK